MLGLELEVLLSFGWACAKLKVYGPAQPSLIQQGEKKSLSTLSTQLPFLHPSVICLTIAYLGVWRYGEANLSLSLSKRKRKKILENEVL